jgi:hypothetical protein
MAEDADDSADRAFEAEMLAAARRLSEEIAARDRRRHLNEVAEAVFLSHAGQPIAVVLIVLWERANTSTHEVSAETLSDAANAISLGRRFGFV